MQHYVAFIPFWQLVKVWFFMWQLLHAERFQDMHPWLLRKSHSLQMISRSWSLLLTAGRQSKVSSAPCLPFLFPITPYGFPQSVMYSIAFRHCAETQARNVFLSKYSQDDSSRLESKPNIRTWEPETSKIHQNSEVTRAVLCLCVKAVPSGPHGGYFQLLEKTEMKLI